jgi:hypothetical protein
MNKIILILLFLSCVLTKATATTNDTLYISPNPCDSMANIHFTIGQTRIVSLNIYDRWGQNIKSFYTNTLLQAGSYDTIYVTDSLMEGNYIVQFKYDTLTINQYLYKIKNANIDTLYVNPNPCDSLATIHFTLANNDSVTLMVYNVLGQLVKTFYVNTALSAGVHSINYVTDSLLNGVYFLKLKGIAFTLTTKFIKDNTTSIDKTLPLNNIRVYPNPVETLLNMDDIGYKHINIINTLGKIVATYTTVDTTINVAQLPAGSYVLLVVDVSGNIINSSKIIKLN